MFLSGHARRVERGQALYRDSDKKNIKAPVMDFLKLSGRCGGIKIVAWGSAMKMPQCCIPIPVSGVDQHSAIIR
jgi:hypothetical protein